MERAAAIIALLRWSAKVRLISSRLTVLTRMPRFAAPLFAAMESARLASAAFAGHPLTRRVAGIYSSNRFASFFLGGTLTAFAPPRKLWTPQSSKRSGPSKTAKPKVLRRTSRARTRSSAANFGIGMGLHAGASTVAPFLVCECPSPLRRASRRRAKRRESRVPLRTRLPCAKAAGDGAFRNARFASDFCNPKGRPTLVG